MRFYLSSCRFVIKPLDKLVLPEYKGVVLRGGLGTVFKDLVCIKRDRDCGTCLISESCNYFKIFETPVPKGAAMMRKYPYAPHPFVITPPLTSQTEFAPSNELSFELTLIGRSVGCRCRRGNQRPDEEGIATAPLPLASAIHAWRESET